MLPSIQNTPKVPALLSRVFERLFHNFGDGLTNAGVGLLDMEHLGDGGGDIGDMYLTTGAAVLYLPAVEQQGDMGIVGIPFAVSGADGR